MDRDRFRQHAKDLRACASLVSNLTQVPDRATPKDFQQASDLMASAANALEELIKAQPPGCICRRVHDDNYDYLDYAEGCLHHRQLYHLREALKADYAKMERALKNEARLKLITAALAGAAMLPSGGDFAHYAERAIEIADETIRRITETT